MTRRRKILIRCAAVLAGLIVIATVAFFIYFPGRQSTLALMLATGIGINNVQAEIDVLEAKAITGETFTSEDKAFLKDLYTCFAKGARLTIVLRQSAQLMDHYLSNSGEDLRIAPRIFLGSRPVREQMADIRERIASDVHLRGAPDGKYSTPVFYMGDPAFFESYVGLYYGTLTAAPALQKDGTVLVQWRADMPWQWPSYESLLKKHGNYHAQCFSLPNVRGILQGPEYCLRMDDGLGEYLAQLGLAKPFLVYSQWREQMPAGESSMPN